MEKYEKEQGLTIYQIENLIILLMSTFRFKIIFQVDIG